jgi:hypothetical protein
MLQLERRNQDFFASAAFLFGFLILKWLEGDKRAKWREGDKRAKWREGDKRAKWREGDKRGDIHNMNRMVNGGSWILRLMN